MKSKQTGPAASEWIVLSIKALVSGGLIGGVVSYIVNVMVRIG
jgi:hypothetical protein